MNSLPQTPASLPAIIPCTETSTPELLVKAPLVSVTMITYNHEPYIGRAIEGVIQQETNFLIELIIGEDCSTDATRAKVLEYQKRYPKIIRVLTSEHNIGARLNSKRVRNAVRGKYVAFCEGDDYWHNPHKLQKQVELLESDPNTGLVHSDVDRYDITRGTRAASFHKKRKMSRAYSNVIHGLIASEYLIETCTAVARTDLLSRIHQECPYEFSETFMMGDTQTWIEIAARSKIFYIDESLATRNLLPESASRFKDSNKNVRFIANCKLMLFHYAGKYGAAETWNLKRFIVARFTPPLFRLAYEIGNRSLALDSRKEMEDFRLHLAPEHHLYIWGTKHPRVRRLIPFLLSVAVPILGSLRIVKHLFAKPAIA